MKPNDMETEVIKVEYDPNELVHKLFERVMESHPGCRITDYRFLGGNVIELTLAH